MGISINYPIDDPRVEPLLTSLKSSLNPSCRLLVGGAAAARHSQALRKLAATEIKDLTMLANTLDEMR